MPVGIPNKLQQLKRHNATLIQVAEAFGVSTWTVRDWCLAAQGEPGTRTNYETPEGGKRLHGAFVDANRWLIPKKNARRFAKLWGYGTISL